VNGIFSGAAQATKTWRRPPNRGQTNETIRVAYRLADSQPILDREVANEGLGNAAIGIVGFRALGKGCSLRFSGGRHSLLICYIRAIGASAPSQPNPNADWETAAGGHMEFDVVSIHPEKDPDADSSQNVPYGPEEYWRSLQDDKLARKSLRCRDLQMNRLLSGVCAGVRGLTQTRTRCIFTVTGKGGPENPPPY